jgi:hypothetical protein
MIAHACAVFSVMMPLAQRQESRIVSGIVIDAESRSPLHEARVSARRSRHATLTDRAGRFSLPTFVSDTLEVRMIGRRPAAIVLDSLSSVPIVVPLVEAAVPLGAIAVTAPGSSISPLTTDVGTWSIPRALVDLVPALAEPDPLRSLVMAAPVAFSSPLSARVLLRGYDADLGGFRLDGHEMTTPFHLGRFFSAIPGRAIERVSLRAFSTDPAHGDALSGVVDVAGRRARGGREIEVNASPVAATALFGHRGPLGSAFLSGRLAWLSAVPIPGDNLAYGFGDAYGRFTVGPAESAELTAYYSNDVVGTASNGMRWTNLLLGARTQASLGSMKLSLAASGTHFGEDLGQGFARETSFDARNETSRIGASAEMRGAAGPMGVLLGLSINRRTVRGAFSPRYSSDSFDTTATHASYIQPALYGELSGGARWVGWAASARVEGGLHGVQVQPRLRARVTLDEKTALSLAAGYASRTYHLVSDPLSEPELSFYDFWLAAGTDTLPVPLVRHLALQLDGGGARSSWRISAYGSDAHDLIELRPFDDTTTVPSRVFRRVNGRTFGLETQLASATESRTQFVLIYNLAWSSRRSESGWHPWLFDRRHSLRGLINGPIGVHWTMSLLGDVSTGSPFTPVVSQYAAGLGDPIRGIARRFDGASLTVYSYGPENSARAGISGHLDFGFTYQGGGPWKSRLALSISIINLFLGRVAPVEPWPPAESWGSPVTYRRAFTLPPIPTINLQIRW